MKKYVLILTAALTAIMLTACGMSKEQIAQSLTTLDSAYQNGSYDQAKAEVDKLDKEYNNMTDEQKIKFGELRSSVENAVLNASLIREALNNAQSFCDQKMFYEANAELDKISGYSFHPTEQAKYDELKNIITSSIETWEVTEELQKIEMLQNSGDYDLAMTTINNLDMSAATDNQRQQYDLLKNKINNSKILVIAENEYNHGRYSSALSTIATVNTAYLTAEQIQRLDTIKNYAEISKQRTEGISEAQARNIAQAANRDMYITSVTSSNYLGSPVYVVGMRSRDPYLGWEIGVVILKSTGAIVTTLA